MKNLLKKVASYVPVEMYSRLTAHAIIREMFPHLKSCRIFQRREQLWDYCLEELTSIDEKITFVEFGVWEGYSIGYFSNKNRNKNSLFVGLDSFEGLPEEWLTLKKGHFSTDGNTPIIEDKRVKFIRGRFQSTYDELYSSISERECFLVHYDADLYSSTLFALTKMDAIKTKYLAIFDEFYRDEVQALYNYIQAYGAKVTFLGKTVTKSGHCRQALCEIVPSY